MFEGVIPPGGPNDIHTGYFLSMNTDECCAPGETVENFGELLRQNFLEVPDLMEYNIHKAYRPYCFVHEKANDYPWLVEMIKEEVQYWPDVIGIDKDSYHGDGEDYEDPVLI